VIKRINVMCGRLVTKWARLAALGIPIRCVRKEHHDGNCSHLWDMAGR
jgi:hypothetical protein